LSIAVCSTSCLLQLGRGVLGRRRPFLQGGLEVGEPTVVALGEQNTELVRSVMPDESHLSFMPDQYLRPASVIKSVHQFTDRTPL
jgi:hypothetical protein